MEINIFDMRRILSFSAIICLVLCCSGCINEKLQGADLKVGDRLPDFSVKMNDGRVVTDEDLIGSVSCVVLFHTSCPDCQNTLPSIQRLYDEYAPETVRFALISREEGAEEIESYWTEKSYDMPYSAQLTRKVYNKFASSRIPRVYISDKDGIIRYIYTDNPIPSYDELKSCLESLIR